MSMPALAPFFAFSPALRARGFPAAPDQLHSFLAAVSLLGPRGMVDIRSAAHAIYGPGPDWVEAFDAAFDEVFLGRVAISSGEAEAEDEWLPPASDDPVLEPMPQEDDPSGSDATALERLHERRFTQDGAHLDAFERALPSALPRRISRRFTRVGGRRPDPARAFRELMRRDGELVRLPTRQRRLRQRPVLMLIDVSGSMKGQTDSVLMLARALTRGAERVETFTLGTRLTRITPALWLRNEVHALERAAQMVSDWDGGTRLGDALSQFVSVPRFSALARGALVIVVSDGLERGGPDALVGAMHRLRGLARNLLWLSPLAADPGFRPETAAMQEIVPMLDRLGNGASLAAAIQEILHFASEVRR